MSSAKCLTVDNRSFVRLLMKIKKESGQKMEACGASFWAGNHSDVWPFIRTLWNLLLKKLSMRFKSDSEIQPQLIWAYRESLVQDFVKSLRYILKCTASFNSRGNIKSYEQLTKTDLRKNHLTKNQTDKLGLVFFFDIFI